jgi:hypothetical protein
MPPLIFSFQGLKVRRGGAIVKINDGGEDGKYELLQVSEHQFGPA